MTAIRNWEHPVSAFRVVIVSNFQTFQDISTTLSKFQTLKDVWKWHLKIPDISRQFKTACEPCISDLTDELLMAQVDNPNLLNSSSSLDQYNVSCTNTHLIPLLTPVITIHCCGHYSDIEYAIDMNFHTDAHMQLRVMGSCKWRTMSNKDSIAIDT
jgi:hypothetical protein